MSARVLALVLGVAFNALGWADSLKPFDAKSPALIDQAHAGRPYVLVLWSIYCEPCRDEMKQWGALQRKHPEVGFVLVSTDLAPDRAAVEKFLAQHELRRVESWIFADEFAERVRYAIDPSWRGELPRTYLFDAQHRRETHSGTLAPKALDIWLARQRRR
jgi:thiol-disulfide isomerase/thioredoxin